jgi:hypothetical protein
LPCKFSNARDALERIKNDGIYEVSPLPATSTNGKPIVPSEYEKRLAGAVVLVRATLVNDFFGKRHQFYADIESISVLRAPTSFTSSSPSKSPSKKMRFEVPSFVSESRKMI